MNQEFKKLFVEALRSGQYKQGVGRLSQWIKPNQIFCALGVACDVVAKNPALVPNIVGEWDAFTENVEAVNPWPFKTKSTVGETGKDLSYTHSFPTVLAFELGMVVDGKKYDKDTNSMVPQLQPNVHWNFLEHQLPMIKQEVFEKTNLNLAIGACCSVAGLNDNKVPFPVIADIVEKYS